MVILVKLSGGLFLLHKATLLLPLLFSSSSLQTLFRNALSIFLRRTNAVIAHINELFLLTRVVVRFGGVSSSGGGRIWLALLVGVCRQKESGRKVCRVFQGRNSRRSGVF